MADLRPIGSEKLEGTDKLKRIMEIANYGRTSSREINESTGSIDYTIQLADVNFYGIVKEKNGYIVKRGINESELEYSEPMKNRKYYSSYSQAMKKVNLIASELNRLHENEQGVSLIGEQKKFVLKTPKAEPQEPEMDSEPTMDVANEPEVSAEPTLDLGDEAMDLGDDAMGLGDEEMDMEISDDEPSEDGDEELSFKTIQKITGKLGQKLRTIDSRQGLSSEDIKYVVNSILSAVDLTKLTEEDYEDVMENFEDVEEDVDGGDETLDMDMEMSADDEGDNEELDLDLDMEVEPEMGEMKEYFYFDSDSESEDDMSNYEGRDLGTKDGYEFLGQSRGDRDEWYNQDDLGYSGDFDFEYDEEEFDDYDTFTSKLPKQKWFSGARGKDMFDLYKEKYGPLKYRRKREMGEGMKSVQKTMDEIFTESKVEKVLSKYFVITEEEKKVMKEKQTKKYLVEKAKSSLIKKEIKKLSETIEQELTSNVLMKEGKNVKFLGKTNKNNLIFEMDGKKVKISTKGEII